MENKRKKIMKSPISIFTRPKIKDANFKDFSFDSIKFVDSEDEADFSIVKSSIEEYDSEFFKERRKKYICLISALQYSQRKNIRNGYCIDDRIDNIPNFKNFCFSTNDFCDIPYLITMPHGPTSAKNVSQKPKYWLDYNIQNTSFHNKVYWCGRSGTHSTTRKPFMNFYNSIDDSRFNISEFQFNVYGGKNIIPSIFTDHIDRLSSSDAAFVLRGDRPYAFSFFDVIMSGCIPIMISSMNYYGWENIFENVDDYMLRFDLREHSMEYIHEQVVLLLEDKDRVLHMKKNIANFYNTFFRHSANFGFGEFLLAKCIEIYKNDFDIEKIDDKFICSEILTLKGLKGKL